MRDRILNEYFEWLSEFVCDEKYMSGNGYRKLLMYLHSTTFRYPAHIPNDGNRAEDGRALRHKFARERDYEDVESYLVEQCSVLEMMVALAVRCENHIMEDTDIGDRTGQWFWGMVTNLGLYSMNDEAFDKAYVSNVIKRFLERKYRDNGAGGLFTVPNCPYDLRNVEIWYQMHWYLDSIISY